MRAKLLSGVAALAVATLLVSHPVVADAARLVTGKDVKNGSLTGKDVKDRSLSAADFAAGQLPAGATGAAGAAGPAGSTGPTGASGALATTAFGSLVGAVEGPIGVSGGYTLLGPTVDVPVGPDQIVQLSVQFSIGSSAGTDVGAAICQDAGGMVVPFSSPLTSTVAGREVISLTTAFRVEEQLSLTMGPCVTGLSAPLDENGAVEGHFTVTTVPAQWPRGPPAVPSVHGHL